MTRNIAPTLCPDKRPISVVIPAAGYGSRMKSHGPKALVKIKDDLTIIDNQLKFIYKYFNKPEVIITSGFDSEKLEQAMKHRRNVKVINNEDWESTNVVRSIALGVEEATHDNILVVYGDLVFNAWTLRVPIGPYSLVVNDRYGLMKSDEVGCAVDNNVLQNMMFGLPNKWAQIAYFTGKESQMLRKALKNPNYYSYFGFEIINIITNSGGIFAVNSNPRMKITDIDSSRDMEKIGEII